MTHAFFKALLFMAAGSIIGAMAGDQSLDRMSGFRKALPFTFACFIVGGLALSGLPPFSGWLSKDDIIAFLDHRGGGFVILGIVGYLGALMTGIYTFRMIFRAFFGEPCEEARELEHGHLAHAEVPRNPMTGEEEDTDVGFPGPGHFIAERECPMKIAMGALAVLAVIGGARPDPGRRRRGHEVPRADVRRLQVRPRRAEHRPAWVGLVIGAVIADRRHLDRLPDLGRAARHLRRACASGSRACTCSSRNKWYFDELIDFVVVRPALWLGRLVEPVLERT